MTSGKSGKLLGHFEYKKDDAQGAERKGRAMATKILEKVGPGGGYPSSDQKTDDFVLKLQRHGRCPSQKGKIAPKGPEPIRVDIIVLHRLQPVGLIKMCPHGRILIEKQTIYIHMLTCQPLRKMDNVNNNRYSRNNRYNNNNR